MSFSTLRPFKLLLSCQSHSDDIDSVLGKRSLIQELIARTTKKIEAMFQLIQSMITKAHPVITTLNTTNPCLHTIFEPFGSG